jgi:8-oxo-dGTP pyrophosphatase MutT (NUDIX family)
MNLEWKKIKEESYKAGWRKMLRKTFVLPNGETADYDILDEKVAVHMVALTPENKVILEKTFRPGTEKIFLDMPAGYVNKNETPKDAASRELLEETGLQGDVELAGISTDDAYRNTERYTFVFKNCKKVQTPRLEGDETFEFVEMDIETFRKHLSSGLVTHAESGYIALDYLKLL